MINKRRPRISFNGFQKHNAATPVTGSDALSDLITGPKSLVDRVRDAHVDKTGAPAQAVPQPFNLSAGLRLFMSVLALVALGVSIYLSYVAITSTKVVGCSGSVFDCSHVLNSRWSTVFGIPVGLPAVGLYVGLLAAMAVTFLAKRHRVKKVAMMIVTASALCAAFAALWFIYLQVFVVEHLCQYCLAAHFCGLLLAMIVFWKRPLGNNFTVGTAGFGFASVGVIVAAQLLATPPETFKIERHPESPAVSTDAEAETFDAPFAPPVVPAEKEDDGMFDAPGQDDSASIPASRKNSLASLKVQFASLLALLKGGSTSLVNQDGQQEEETTEQDADQKTETKKTEEARIVSFSGGSVKLNAAHWPMVGKPEAKYMFVEMYDYTCSHCRETHASIRGAREALGDDLAIVMLPVPMSRACNPSVTADNVIHAEACELSKIAIAVWRIDAAKFSEFHEWMFDGAAAPSAVAAKSKAGELVDKDLLEKEMAGKVVNQYIAAHAELYKKVGAGSIPKMLFPATSVIGKYTSTDGLVEMIKREAK